MPPSAQDDAENPRSPKQEENKQMKRSVDLQDPMSQVIGH